MMNWRPFAGLAIVILGALAYLAVLLTAPIFASSGVAPNAGWDPKQVKLIGSIVVSIVLGGFAIYLITRAKSGSPEKDREWGFATLGMIGGYWLPAK